MIFHKRTRAARQPAMPHAEFSWRRSQPIPYGWRLDPHLSSYLLNSYITLLSHSSIDSSSFSFLHWHLLLSTDNSYFRHFLLSIPPLTPPPLHSTIDSSSFPFPHWHPLLSIPPLTPLFLPVPLLTPLFPFLPLYRFLQFSHWHRFLSILPSTPLFRSIPPLTPLFRSSPRLTPLFPSIFPLKPLFPFHSPIDITLSFHSASQPGQPGSQQRHTRSSREDVPRPYPTAVDWTPIPTLTYSTLTPLLFPIPPLTPLPFHSSNDTSSFPFPHWHFLLSIPPSTPPPFHSFTDSCSFPFLQWHLFLSIPPSTPPPFHSSTDTTLPSLSPFPHWHHSFVPVLHWHHSSLPFSRWNHSSLSIAPLTSLYLPIPQASRGRQGSQRCHTRSSREDVPRPYPTAVDWTPISTLTYSTLTPLLFPIPPLTPLPFHSSNDTSSFPFPHWHFLLSIPPSTPPPFHSFTDSCSFPFLQWHLFLSIPPSTTPPFHSSTDTTLPSLSPFTHWHHSFVPVLHWHHSSLPFSRWNHSSLSIPPLTSLYLSIPQANRGRQGSQRCHTRSSREDVASPYPTAGDWTPISTLTVHPPSTSGTPYLPAISNGFCPSEDSHIILGLSRPSGLTWNGSVWGEWGGGDGGRVGRVDGKV